MVHDEDAYAASREALAAPPEWRRTFFSSQMSDAVDVLEEVKSQLGYRDGGKGGSKGSWMGVEEADAVEDDDAIDEAVLDVLRARESGEISEDSLLDIDELDDAAKARLHTRGARVTEETLDEEVRALLLERGWRPDPLYDTLAEVRRDGMPRRGAMRESDRLSAAAPPPRIPHRGMEDVAAEYEALQREELQRFQRTMDAANRRIAGGMEMQQAWDEARAETATAGRTWEQYLEDVRAEEVEPPRGRARPRARIEVGNLVTIGEAQHNDADVLIGSRHYHLNGNDWNDMEARNDFTSELEALRRMAADGVDDDVLAAAVELIPGAVRLDPYTHRHPYTEANGWVTDPRRHDQLENHLRILLPVLGEGEGHAPVYVVDGQEAYGYNATTGRLYRSRLGDPAVEVREPVQLRDSLRDEDRPLNAAAVLEFMRTQRFSAEDARAILSDPDAYSVGDLVAISQLQVSRADLDAQRGAAGGWQARSDAVGWGPAPQTGRTAKDERLQWRRDILRSEAHRDEVNARPQLPDELASRHPMGPVRPQWTTNRGVNGSSYDHSQNHQYDRYERLAKLVAASDEDYVIAVALNTIGSQTHYAYNPYNGHLLECDYNGDLVDRGKTGFRKLDGMGDGPTALVQAMRSRRDVTPEAATVILQNARSLKPEDIDHVVDGVPVEWIMAHRRSQA